MENLQSNETNSSALNVQDDLDVGDILVDAKGVIRIVVINKSVVSGVTTFKVKEVDSFLPIDLIAKELQEYATANGFVKLLTTTDKVEKLSKNIGLAIDLEFTANGKTFVKIVTEKQLCFNEYNNTFEPIFGIFDGQLSAEYFASEKHLQRIIFMNCDEFENMRKEHLNLESDNG